VGGNRCKIFLVRSSVRSCASGKVRWVKIGVRYSSSIRPSVDEWEGEVGGNKCKYSSSVRPFVAKWEGEVGGNMCKIFLVRPSVRPSVGI